MPEDFSSADRRHSAENGITVGDDFRHVVAFRLSADGFFRAGDEIVGLRWIIEFFERGFYNVPRFLGFLG